MSQKRRQKLIKEAKRAKRGKSAYKLTDLLSVDESPICPIPRQFDSRKHYFGSFKGPILAEAKNLLSVKYYQRLNKASLYFQLSESNDEEVLKCGARLLHLNPIKAINKDQYELMRPGQVFVLRSVSKKYKSEPILSAWANGFSRDSDTNSSLILMIFSSYNFESRHFEALPLESLLSLQRMYDACIRQTSPPFLGELLMGKKSSHIRFDTDSEQEVSQGEQHNYDQSAINSDLSLSPLMSTLCDAKARLNQSQKRALLDFTEGISPKITLVQGPPGTGKTSFLVTTLLHLAAEITRQNNRNRVLVCAPSNKATCLLLERFTSAICANNPINTLSMVCNVVLLGVPDKIKGAISDKSVCPDLLCWNEFESLSRQVKRLKEEARVASWNSTTSNCGEVAFHQLLQSTQRRWGRQFFTFAIKELFDEVGEQMQYTNNWTELFGILSNRILQLSSDHHLSTQAAKACLDNADIVFTTLGSAGQSILRPCKSYSNSISSGSDQSLSSSFEGFCHNVLEASGFEEVEGFESVLVDEAGQALEAETLIPIGLGCRRLLLVGDPKQLPATVTSQIAEGAQFGRSLLERLMGSGDQHDGLPCHLLDTQYRMSDSICRFPNHVFYGGALRSDPATGRCSVWNCDSWADQTDRELTPPELREAIFGGSYLWAHIGGDLNVLEPKLTCFEKRVQDTRSIINEKEAGLIVDMVRWFVDGEQPLIGSSHVVVIAMYSAQVSLIRRLLCHGVNANQPSSRVAVHTVDSFQGSEASIVLVSMVRSNHSGSLGFLKDGRRLNVAITRAQDLLVVVGDGNTTRNRTPVIPQVSHEHAVVQLFQDALINQNVKTEGDLRKSMEFKENGPRSYTA